MEKKLKVILVESSFMIRSYLELLINKSDRYNVIAVCADSNEVVDICKKIKADLIVMEAYSNNNQNGFETVKKIKSSSKYSKVIMYTDLPEISFLSRAKESGCDSFWYKDGDGRGLIEIMDITNAGGSSFPLNAPAVNIGCTLSNDFSSAENGVLIKLSQGKTNQVIAEELKISINTVKYHIKNMLVKSGYNNKYLLALEAVDKRMIVPSLYQ